MNRLTEKRSLLLVEDDPGDVELVARFLSRTGEEFQLTTVHTLADALSTLAKGPFDAVLLDQGLPDSRGQETFVELHKHVREVPVVVLTGMDDQDSGLELVRLGAQDYLVKGSFDAALLVRVLRYSIERWALIKENDRLRLVEAREREIKALAIVADLSTDDRQGQTQPLKATAPAVFTELSLQFDRLLDLAVERRVYKGDTAQLTNQLRELAAGLVRIDGGPREIVDLYSTALSAKLQTSGSRERSQAFIDEGRLVLLEAMGALIKAYRLDHWRLQQSR